MGVLFLIVFLFVAILIVGLVLLQEGKGGGLTGMSTGMDGVMGAKNPLRRMTAWLFAIFVVLAISINWYFHSRGDTSVPEGLALPEPTVVEESQPFTGPLVLSDQADAPASAQAESEVPSLPVPDAPAASVETPAQPEAAPPAPVEATPAAE